MFLTAASTFLPGYSKPTTGGQITLALEGTLPAEPASPVEVELDSHPSGNPRLLPSGLIPSRKLRTHWVSPKATKSWLPGEATPRSAGWVSGWGIRVQGLLEGHWGPGPPLIPSHFQQGKGSRKTPGTPGARKEAGRAPGQVCARLYSLRDTWQLTLDKMSNKNWL